MVDGPGNSAGTKTLHGVTYDYGMLSVPVDYLCRLAFYDALLCPLDTCRGIDGVIVYGGCSV